MAYVWSFTTGQAGAATGEAIKTELTPSLWLCSHDFLPLSKRFKLEACRIAASGLQAKVLFIQFVSSRISFPVWKNKNQLNSSTLPSFLFMVPVENPFSSLRSSSSAEDCERPQDRQCFWGSTCSTYQQPWRYYSEKITSSGLALPLTVRASSWHLELSCRGCETDQVSVPAILVAALDRDCDPDRDLNLCMPIPMLLPVLSNLASYSIFPMRLC